MQGAEGLEALMTRRLRLPWRGLELFCGVQQTFWVGGKLQAPGAKGQFLATCGGGPRS